MNFLGITITKESDFSSPIDWEEVIATVAAWVVILAAIAAAWYVWGVAGIISGVGTAYLFLTEPWHWGLFGLLALPLLIIIGLFMDD